MNDKVQELLGPYSAGIQVLVSEARQHIHQLAPDAQEEVDLSARLIGFTFIPGTYKGTFVALVLQKDHVNLMFAKGVELKNVDTANLLEGTGKVARHIKLRSKKDLNNPAIHSLVKKAASLTPRTK